MSVYRNALLGLAIGDALGVPYELAKREDLAKDPVKDMVGHLAHDQPAGTWSDDGSMTFCTAEALIDGFSTRRMGSNFLRWFDNGWWSAHGKAFGSGGTTRKALKTIRSGWPAEKAGSSLMEDNGNGSLMRILPLAFYMRDHTMAERWDITRRVSSITHSHINCAIACFIYLEYARALLEDDKALHSPIFHYIAVGEVAEFLQPYSYDLKPFERVLSGKLHTLAQEDIKSSGYVVDTLEVSLWCFMTAVDFQHAVLKAVNLGDDTDTTGAVTGGLAGLYWGTDRIPKEWMESLARRWDIIDLAERLEKRLEL